MIIQKSNSMVRTFIYKVSFFLSVVIILYATLWREKGTGDIDLHLFWTIRQAWSRHSGYHWYLIIGNIALFIPFGISITLLMMQFKWQWTVVPGFLISLFIEVTQYLTDRGLCELDDILHNTWGTILGYCIVIVIWNFIGREKGIKNRQVIISTLFLVTTIIVFVVLIVYNDPDWSSVKLHTR